MSQYDLNLITALRRVPIEATLYSAVRVAQSRLLYHHNQGLLEKSKFEKLFEKRNTADYDQNVKLKKEILRHRTSIHFLNDMFDHLYRFAIETADEVRPDKADIISRAKKVIRHIDMIKKTLKASLKSMETT